MTLLVRLLTVWIFLATTAACSGKIEHDLDLATKRAVEFTDTIFVRRDLEKAYSLLDDKARSYIPFNKFEETVSMLRCNRVTAEDAAPRSPHEKVINVVLICGDTNDRTNRITVTLTGTATSDYRVTKFVRWKVPLPPKGTFPTDTNG